MSEPNDTPAEATRAPRGLARTFSAFSNRDFRLMWSGAFLSTTGTWMQTVAQAWVVYSLTSSALLLGTDAFLSAVPMIIFSLLGGVIADRIERRKILLMSQYLQMTFAFVLATLIYTKHVQIWHIFVLSFLTGSVQAFGAPAYQALLPLIVKKEQVPNAVAMNSLQFNLARMIGPILAGLALNAKGAAFCFFLNGLSFIPVIISLLLIRTSFLPERNDNRSIRHEMREGIGYVLKDRPIAQLTLIATITTFFGTPLVTMLPVVARTVFSVGARGYGWMLTASGAGSVTGALLVASLGTARRKGLMAISCQFVFSICLLLFSFSTHLWSSVLCLYVGGAALLGVVTSVSSLVQLTTAERLRGRVMSIFMMAFRGGMPLGNLAAGFIAETRGVTFALALNGVLLLLTATVLLVTRNEVKRL